MAPVISSSSLGFKLGSATPQKIYLGTNQVWAPAASDPNWSDVILLLKAEGTQGSTVFTDLSTSAVSITTQGNAKVSTADPKFGTGSLDCTVEGSRLTLPSGSLFDLNYSTSFTLEFFAKMPVEPVDNQYSFEMSSFDLGQTMRVIFFPTRRVDVIVRGAQLSSSSNVLPVNAWFHFAVTWDNSFVRAFIDGTLIGSVTRSNSGSLGNAQTIAIGGRGNGNNSLLGFMDEIRFTRNVARYTANFTPPTATFPVQ